MTATTTTYIDFRIWHESRDKRDDGKLIGYGLTVSGEYVGEIAPHLAGVMTPVLHYHAIDGYCVSEIETGRRVAGGYPLAAMALEEARHRCSRKTQADIESVFVQATDEMRGW